MPAIFSIAFGALFIAGFVMGALSFRKDYNCEADQMCTRGPISKITAGAGISALSTIAFGLVSSLYGEMPLLWSALQMVAALAAFAALVWFDVRIWRLLRDADMLLERN